MILTEAQRNKIEDDCEMAIGKHAFDAIESEVIEKLCAGVKVPEAVGQIYGVAGVQHCSTTANAPDGPLFSERQLRAYGAACRLKALEDAAVRSWSHHMDHSKKIGVSPDVYSRFSPTAAIRALKGEAP